VPSISKHCVVAKKVGGGLARGGSFAGPMRRSACYNAGQKDGRTGKQITARHPPRARTSKEFPPGQLSNLYQTNAGTPWWGVSNWRDISKTVGQKRRCREMVFGRRREDIPPGRGIGKIKAQEAAVPAGRRGPGEIPLDGRGSTGGGSLP